MLFLGAPEFRLNKRPAAKPEEGNLAVWQFYEKIRDVAKKKHFDVLSLYNSTASFVGGRGDVWAESYVS